MSEASTREGRLIEALDIEAQAHAACKGRVKQLETIVAVLASEKPIAKALAQPRVTWIWLAFAVGILAGLGISDLWSCKP